MTTERADVLADFQGFDTHLAVGGQEPRASQVTRHSGIGRDVDAAGGIRRQQEMRSGEIAAENQCAVERGAHRSVRRCHQRIAIGAASQP